MMVFFTASCIMARRIFSSAKMITDGPESEDEDEDEILEVIQEGADTGA
jgi:hypothetical protein